MRETRRTGSMVAFPSVGHSTKDLAIGGNILTDCANSSVHDACSIFIAVWERPTGATANGGYFPFEPLVPGCLGVTIMRRSIVLIALLIVPAWAVSVPCITQCCEDCHVPLFRINLLESIWHGHGEQVCCQPCFGKIAGGEATQGESPIWANVPPLPRHESLLAEVAEDGEPPTKNVGEASEQPTETVLQVSEPDPASGVSVRILLP